MFYKLAWIQRYYIIERASVLLLPLIIVVYGGKISGELDLAIQLTSITALSSALLTFGRTETLIRTCAKLADKAESGYQMISKELLLRLACGFPLLLMIGGFIYFEFQISLLLIICVLLYSWIGSISMFGYLFNRIRLFALLAIVDISSFCLALLLRESYSAIQSYFIISSLLRLGIFIEPLKNLCLELSHDINFFKTLLPRFKIAYSLIISSTGFAWLGIICNSLLSKLDPLLIALNSNMGQSQVFSYFAVRRIFDIFLLVITTMIGFKYQELVNPALFEIRSLKNWIINLYIISLVLFSLLQPVFFIILKSYFSDFPLHIAILIELCCMLAFWGSCKSSYYARCELEKLNGKFVIISAVAYTLICILLKIPYGVVYALFGSQLLLNLILPVFKVEIDRQLLKTLLRPGVFIRKVVKIASTRQLA